MELQLTNVIDISVAAAGRGVGDFNTSNLALFTRETPADSFGSHGYKIYVEPTDVATDFGTGSQTFKMANTVFSQQPNILANNGYLVIITYADTSSVTAVQRVDFSAPPASGAYKLKHGTDTTSSIAFDATAGTIQSALQALTGFSSVTVTGTAATHLTITFTGVSGAVSLLTSSTDSLQTATPVNVDITVSNVVIGTTASTETLAQAVVRTEDLVQYFGVMTAEIIGSTPILAAAAVIQPLNKIAFFVSSTEADLLDGGAFVLVQLGSFTKSRCLYYGGLDAPSTLGMMAAYAGRALSVNFNGSNTTITMHLKDLIGVEPDPTMTQTILTEAQAAGADTYINLQGIPKVFCSGANSFYDQVYNLQWFVSALQVAGFNYLAQSATKVPQTEDGMSGLKGAYRQVCQQAAVNQYVAPGKWNSSTTFGNQGDFLANIGQVGYYIFSLPVAQQSQSQRVARTAPLVQIAIKEAGAIHRSDVIININA